MYRIDRAIVVRDVTLGFPRIYPRDADTNAPSYRANMYRCGTRTPLHPRYLHTDGYTNTNRVLSSLRIALFKQASRCTFPNFIIGRRGYPCALVCAFVTSVCVHLYPHPSLSRARARARDFRSLVSMQTHSFVPWRKGNGSRRGWVKKEKEKRVKKITSSNRNSPRPCCFVIVHTVYIIHTNNISPCAGETMLLTRPLLLPCKHFHRLSFFSSSVLSTR